MRNGATVPRLLVVGVTLVLALTGCQLGGNGDRTDEGVTSPTERSTGADGLPEPVAQKAWPLGVRGVTTSPDGGPYLQASVYGVYGKGAEMELALGLSVVKAPGKGANARLTGTLAAQHSNADDPSQFGTTGLTLVDSVAKRAYLPARDAEGKCLCSDTPQVSSGVTTLIRAKFAASGTDAVDVVIPKIGVLPDVPVTVGAAPKSVTSPGPSLTQPAEGKKLPKVLVAELDSDQPAARRPVVDVDTPVANLDASVTERRDRVVLAADVLFDFDKATLSPKAKARIAETAEVLKKKATGQVRVNGYTDSKGTDSYNAKLSQRRADAVSAELTEQLRGSGLTLAPKGYGAANPVAPNTVQGKDNPEGRALNRRVETVYKPKSAPSSSTGPTSGGSTAGGATPQKAVKSRQITASGQRVTVEMYGVHRHGNLATLEFGVRMPAGGTIRGLFSKTSQLDDDVTGVDLVDKTNERRYLPANYGEESFGSTNFGRSAVNAGQVLRLSATYAAPPSDVSEVDVRTPHTGTFTGIPVE